MLKRRSITLLLVVCMLLTTFQFVPVSADDTTAQTPGLKSYTWDFKNQSTGNLNMSDAKMSNDAQKGNNRDIAAEAPKSTFEVVEDSHIGHKVLKWTAKTNEYDNKTRAFENLYFELPEAINTADGPFKITMKYWTKVPAKRVDGTCSFIGRDANGTPTNLNFGIANWSSPQANISMRVYSENDAYTLNNNKYSQLFQIDDNNWSIDKNNNNEEIYITYEYYVDPVTKQFKVFYQPDNRSVRYGYFGEKNGNGNYISSQETAGSVAHTFNTGELPAQIDKLRFSSYEFYKASEVATDKPNTSFDVAGEFKIDYVKIEQTTSLAVENTTPASGSIFEGNTASVEFNTALAADTVNGNTVKVTKNNEQLLYGTDYTASVDSDNSKKLNIVFTKDAAKNEKYEICITKDINNKTGYTKMQSDYTFNLVTNHTYVDYEFDFSNIAVKKYTEKTNVTDIPNFSTDTKYADFSIVNDGTKNVLQWDWKGNQDLNTTNRKRTAGENLYFELPEPINPANGPFTVELRYQVKDNPRDLDGMAFVGGSTETKIGACTTNNLGSAEREKIYANGNEWDADEVKINNAKVVFLTKSQQSGTVEKYITYKYVVDTSSNTYRAYWKLDTDKAWREPYEGSVAGTKNEQTIKYPFSLTTLPDTISKLKFSLFQTLNSSDETAIAAAKAMDSTYYMDYVKVSQNPLTVTNCEKTENADGKMLLNVYFDGNVSGTTVNADTVKLYKNGNALTYLIDYTVSVSENGNQIQIKLLTDAAETDNIDLVIEDTINSTVGYSKLLSTYKYSTKNSVEITSVVYKNSNGASIDTPDKITDGTLNVNATVLNNSGTSLNESVILIAIFDNEHKLITCSLNDLNDSLANGKSKEINKTFTNLGSNVKSVELFVFNNMNEIIPITSAYNSNK